MKFSRILANVLIVISIAAILCMLALVISDILMRTILNMPLLGSTEMVRMMMICITPSFAATVLADRHVKVGILVDRFSRRGQLIADTIIVTAMVIISALISWQAYEAMKYALKYNEYYTILLVPKWPFELIFCVAMAAVAFCMIIYIIERFQDKDSYKRQVEKNEKKKTERVELF